MKGAMTYRINQHGSVYVGSVPARLTFGRLSTKFDPRIKTGAKLEPNFIRNVLKFERG